MEPQSTPGGGGSPGEREDGRQKTGMKRRHEEEDETSPTKKLVDLLTESIDKSDVIDDVLLMTCY